MFNSREGAAALLTINALHIITTQSVNHNIAETVRKSIKCEARSTKDLLAFLRKLKSLQSDLLGEPHITQYFQISLSGLINDKPVKSLEKVSLDEFEQSIENLSFEPDPKRRRWSRELRML